MTEGVGNIAHWKEVFELGGTAAALLFTGVALHVDARTRRAQSLIEITKMHRELLGHFYERPALKAALDPKRDTAAHPLTDEELHFLKLLIGHLRVSWFAHQSRVYVAPERLPEDIREVFSLPGPRSAWEQLRKYQDAKFVAFVEGALGQDRR